MSAQPIRLLGLTLEKVADFRTQRSAKNAGFYAALDQRFHIEGLVRPTFSRFDTLYNRVSHFHPDFARWRSQNHVNIWALKRRTAIAEHMLRAWDGKYDLIMQLHTLMAPGLDLRKRRYALHTDNTYMLSERYYPGWATLSSRRDRDEWVHIEGEIYRNARLLFPRTEILRRSMIEDYGCDPARVVVVGYGANFTAPSIEQRRYDSQVALFVGIDFKRKGGPGLLKAWPEVRRRLPQARLLIVGPPKLTTPLPAGVEWLGLVQDRARLAQLYLEAATFVMPSIYEPSGNVFLEAMGHGTPCISTNRGANPEIIDHEKNGLLVPVNEPEPLAAAIIRILSDPPYAEQLGRQAYQHVLRGFTWEDVIERMAPHIEQVVSERIR